MIYTRLNIEEEIYNTIKMVPGSIAVISKLCELINLILLILKYLACVSQKASEDARKKQQDLFEKNVHLFELEFCPELVFRDKKRKLER